MSAASRVKRLLGQKVEVIVYEKGRWISFALCGTPYYIGCYVKNLFDLIHYPIEEFTRRRGIKVELNTEVVSVDVEKKVVEWKRGNEKGETKYDYLVIATGAKPVVPLNWIGYENVFVLHSLDDAERIRNYMTTRAVRRVAIVGGGYIGFELSEALRSLGKEVILIEALDRILPRMLDKDMAEHIYGMLESNNVNVKIGKKVKGIEGVGEKAQYVVLEDDSHIEVDAVIVAIGIKPNTELAERAGLKIGQTGALWVNEYMQTNVEHVYAAGDVVETRDLITGDRIWAPLAPAANKMGYVAGTNIAGQKARFPGIVRTSVTMAFGNIVAATGLTEEEAMQRGIDTIAVKIESNTKAAYAPIKGRITLKVIADAKTGKLLGAQAIGTDESAFWRINVIAALLYKQGTVWDLFYGDWGYMPLVAPVWDPLVIAARLLMRKLGETSNQV